MKLDPDSLLLTVILIVPTIAVIALFVFSR